MKDEIPQESECLGGLTHRQHATLHERADGSAALRLGENLQLPRTPHTVMHLNTDDGLERYSSSDEPNKWLRNRSEA